MNLNHIYFFNNIFSILSKRPPSKCISGYSSFRQSKYTPEMACSLTKGLSTLTMFFFNLLSECACNAPTASISLSEISRMTKIEKGGGLKLYLDNLVRASFIREYQTFSFGKNSGTRTKTYNLGHFFNKKAD